MVRNMPEGPKPESLHNHLVYYLGNGERLRLREYSRARSALA
jgi:hypothetical protein